jgi:group I intron endonuclease
MQKIANFLEISDHSFKQKNVTSSHKKYLKLTFKTQNIRSNEILINYLNTHPLFSTNFLNFKDFELILGIFKKFKLNDKLECDLDNLDLPSFRGGSLTAGDLIDLIKKRMHHNRTIFNWDHLANLPNLNLAVTSYPSNQQTTKRNILNINKIYNLSGSTRKYSTCSRNKNKLVNTNNLDSLKINKNIFVSSVVYNNPEEEKLIILADTNNKAGIYIWTHLDSSKKYVGSSVNLSRRLSYYFSKNIIRYNKSKIYNALLSHGYSAFSLTILEYIDIKDLPKDEAKKLIIEREQYYIDNILPEYNILKTAGSLLGFKHLDDTLIKFKKAKGNENNPMFGKSHSLETKLKMSELKKGKSRSENTRFKIGLSCSKQLYIYLNDSQLERTSSWRSQPQKIFFKSFDNYSEAAKFLDCSTRTISRYVDKNKLLKKK